MSLKIQENFSIVVFLPSRYVFADAYSAVSHLRRKVHLVSANAITSPTPCVCVVAARRTTSRRRLVLSADTQRLA